MRDRFGREIDYMRISITDRCDLRCRYCMPPEGIEKLSMDKILTYEEIILACEAAASVGINKFKITGGEPLVRKGCVSLCSKIKSLPGVEQVTLTTNGQLLKDFAQELAKGGIDGINVSLDSLKEDRYALITGGGRLDKAVEGIKASLEWGIKTKVNCLIQKDVNEDELMDFCNLAFELGIDVRFIEIMPIGYGKPDTGVSNDVILSRIKSVWPEIMPDSAIHGNGPAVYYKLPEKKGSIGLISAMYGRFCDNCNRLRLTSQGMIKPCLCYEASYDLRPALRTGSTEMIAEGIKDAVMQKPEGHTFEKRETVERKSMASIGG